MPGPVLAAVVCVWPKALRAALYDQVGYIMMYDHGICGLFSGFMIMIQVRIKICETWHLFYTAFEACLHQS
jgi:hypothetical protein